MKVFILIFQLHHAMKLQGILLLPLFIASTIGTIIPTQVDLEPKTIHISSTAGGISHIAWTLEIGKVLAERGHNVSFLTIDPYIKFGVPYEPHIKTISMGPHISNVQFRDLFDTDDAFSTKVTDAYTQVIEDTYIRDYFAYKYIFSSSNTSIVICDQLSLPCFDAAKELNIPMVIHMTMSLSRDARAPFITFYHLTDQPTTLHQSFSQRFYERYILLPKFIYRYLPVAVAIKKARQTIDVEGFDPLARDSNVIKMVNSFWGLESPRPVGPLVEYVGPIIGTSYESLPSYLIDFMQQHQRVIYIAFGQMYNPSYQEFNVLLTSLLEAYENGFFDGFIWSLSKTSRQGLPKKIKTNSGKTYSVQGLFDGSYSDLRFELWSPQFAILDHEHCKLFVSHGGASSIHESLYNGVPLLLHPFTSDQPANAHNIANAGVALVLDRKAHNVTDTFEKLRAILLDKDGFFASNMEGMQKLVQLKSKRKHYAADIIEEVLYTVRNQSDIWHRREVREKISWFKATNWDVDLVALVIMLVVAISISKAIWRLLNKALVPRKWKIE
ncbi:hypothetical protein [Parasitella parasitica]|uniref:Uncharacterized protein n=1 Tax=Parasitella parasitica TaxID=35722 RepID=A0A0B7NTR0_9FUNG|nr:hypothetical protein [Parasitella parasitica]